MLTRRRMVTSTASGLLLTGCGITGPAHTQRPPPAVDHTVQMVGTSFEPASIRITQGQTIQWRNTSLLTHTVTADPELAADPDHVQLPADAETFHSGNIAAGEVWQRSFSVPGTYRYICIPHEQLGMVGTIVVEPS